MGEIAVLPEERFEAVLRDAPLVSIDLLISIEGRILLGRRVNRPAQGAWFVPGGRILKNETLRAAFSRISAKEVGVALPLAAACFYGVFEHFYEDDVFDRNVGTHYVVLAYILRLDEGVFESLPKGEHSRFELFRVDELCAHSEVHPYTKQYFERVSET